MNLQVRKEMVASGHLLFQRPSQKSDLLDPSITQDVMLGDLEWLISKGYYIELTAVKTDHPDDRPLGLHCHFNGFCFDCWPCRSGKPGDYMSPNTHNFRQFLVDMASCPHNYQIGLAGHAYSTLNMLRAGRTAFRDSGGDHIHHGSH